MEKQATISSCSTKIGQSRFNDGYAIRLSYSSGNLVCVRRTAHETGVNSGELEIVKRSGDRTLRGGGHPF